MLRALLKKQFLEIAALYTTKKNRKDGTIKRSGVKGFIALFIFLFILFALSLGSICVLFAMEILNQGVDWFYFVLTGVMTVFLGVFGSVFNTYASLYNAKDNELLLSLPVKPGYILLSRMIGDYLLALFFELAISLPTVILYWVFVDHITVLTIIGPILFFFCLSLITLALTCILGWLVALVVSRVKSKVVLTVLMAVLIFGLYYLIYFRLNGYIENLMENLSDITASLSQAALPLVIFGKAGTGDPISTLILLAVSALAAGLVYYALSASFIRITTRKTGSVTVRKQEKAHASKLSATLFRRELKRFTASPTYMMNGALGLLLIPLLGIVALANQSTLLTGISEISTEIGTELGHIAIPNFFSGIIGIVLAFAASMNCISSPSVSLEGKSIWVIQSLPVDAKKVLNAKLGLHLVVNGIMIVIGSVLFGITFQVHILGILAAILFSMSYAWLSGALGLIIGIKKPILDWTNEAVPVKQSVGILITLLGGWLVCMALVPLVLVFGIVADTSIILIGLTIILSLIAFFLTMWIQHRGAQIFAKL